MYDALRPYEDYLILPAWNDRADPAWFAFPITVRSGAPFTRRDLNGWLEERNIETRLLFGGNIVRQPGYRDIGYRAVGDLPHSDTVLRSSFFIGVYPGLDDARMDYVIHTLETFFAQQRSV